MAPYDHNEFFRSLPFHSVSLNYRTVHLFSPEELAEGQIGYSVDPAGNSLVEDVVEGWRPQWLVIGYEDMCGDPIFIDAVTEGHPVYTAMHGEGTWEPNQIALDLPGFVAALLAISLVAKGREYPTAFEANPIPEGELQTTLESIQRSNPGIDMEFWQLWLSVAS